MIIIKSTMYIICPSCSTKFVIESHQIGKNGRKARCSKCQHVWFVEPDNKIKQNSNKPKSSSKKPIIAETKLYDREDRLLPAIINKENNTQSICFYKWTLVFLALLFIILLDMIDFGQFKFSDDFSVSGVNTTVIDSNKIRVECTISNNTLNTMNLPIIRYRFYDKNNKIIVRKLVENNMIKLEQGKSINITKEFEVHPANLDITLGSKLDFILRY